jgi:hypothetical protein
LIAGKRTSVVIANGSDAIQFTKRLWMASSLSLLAMTMGMA